MAQQIFVNLPVKDINRSVEFFTKLGYSFNPRYTNDSGVCMIITEDILVMLLTDKFFQTFTKKDICDATKSTEAIICLSAESRDEVDEMISKAIAAGGTAPNDKQEHGFMYGHGFNDLDGHMWEYAWMDPNYKPE